MKLEVGGGLLVHAGWENVDPVHGSRPEFVTRIQDGLPAEFGEIADEIRASHVMEHVPAGAERVAAMNEMRRLLRPGGTLEIVGPVVGWTDHAGDGGPRFTGWQPWADPTHVSFWWYPESFWYFTGGPGGAFRANADYGILYWEEVSMELLGGWEAHVKLRKPWS